MFPVMCPGEIKIKRASYGLPSNDLNRPFIPDYDAHGTFQGARAILSVWCGKSNHCINLENPVPSPEGLVYLECIDITNRLTLECTHFNLFNIFMPART